MSNSSLIDTISTYLQQMTGQGHELEWRKEAGEIISIIRQHFDSPEMVEGVAQAIGANLNGKLFDNIEIQLTNAAKTAIAAMNMGGVPSGLLDGEQTGPVTPPANLSQGEISAVDYHPDDAEIALLIRQHTNCGALEGSALVKAIRPYLRTTEPVSIDEKLATRLVMALMRVTDRFRLAVNQKPVRDMDETLGEVEAVIKATAKAAGMKYVD